ncbi:YqgQ family protein [Ectobacillus sp. sgz5001026]|uniref:YqgQ family protein n=1 Tax=Ectobacillus sp. sgz5001026 TaxID=3242473 RepID=UPI0036D3F258
MTSIYDIQQVLKKFGTFIYTGDRLADLELMHDELVELYHAQLIEKQLFDSSILVLKQEMQRVKGKSK